MKLFSHRNVKGGSTAVDVDPVGHCSEGLYSNSIIVLLHPRCIMEMDVSNGPRQDPGEAKTHSTAARICSRLLHLSGLIAMHAAWGPHVCAPT